MNRNRKNINGGVKQMVKESVYDWLEAAVFALIMIVFIFSFCFRMVGVNGDSMNDTLYEGDRLLLRTNRYTPVFGDIVVIERAAEKPLIKRVIGVAGDKIRVDAAEHTVYRNDRKLIEPYVAEEYRQDFWKGQEEITVPEGMIYVLGDHRNLSLDSRMLGLIDLRHVMGKAYYRVFPFDQFGSIYEQEAYIEEYSK